MEIQDISAIVAAARERGVTVAVDNSYSTGVLLDAFALGVDYDGRVVWLNVGLEEVVDLKADLESGFAALG
jgi:cysteine-S-conjugate beta-lyase